MQPKFIKSGGTATKRHSVDVPVGRYSALFFVLYGAADEGQSLDPAELGRLRVVRNGQDVQGESLRFYHDLTDLKGGAPTLENEAGEQQRFFAIVPFAFPGLANSMDIRSKEETDVVISLDDALDTVFDGEGTWELYGLEAPATVESYTLLVREQDVQASGAGRLEDTLNGRNSGALYIYDDDDILDTLQVEVDGTTVVDNISFPLLLDLTNAENRIENKRIDLKETQWVDGVAANALNATTDVSYFVTDAGTVEVTVLQIRRNENVGQSRRRVQQHLAQRTGVEGEIQRTRGLRR